jgi:hypothetical protein
MHRVLSDAYRAWIAELERMDAGEARIRPEGKQHLWHAGEITEHVLLSMRDMRVSLEKRVLRDRVPEISPRTRVEWLLQIMVLGLGHMPVGVPAPAEWTPTGELTSLTGRELARRLAAEIDAADAMLDLCRERFGMERVGRHFLLGPLRVDQWRRYHVLHLRHHHRQLQQLRWAPSVQMAAPPLLARA